MDYTGIARALVQDVLKRRAAQGGSTITQQFVKNALDAQGDRSVFQKLREAALAYHLERKWSKEKILTQYLNTVYFGNGAYGIEAAVRTYFGDGDEPDERAGADDAGVSYTPPVVEEEQDPDAREAVDVAPHEAALLAGMIASPSMYDPIAAPAGRDGAPQPRAPAHARHEDDHPGPVRRGDPPEPARRGRRRPAQHRVAAALLHDLDDRAPARQVPARQGVRGRPQGPHDDRPRAPGRRRERDRRPARRRGPDAALVAIKNSTGEVRAMVGGSDFNARPFNLATNGHRQPGSSFKPFILARALEDGIDPNSTWASQPQPLPVRGQEGPELFKVSNYEDSYLGAASLCGRPPPPPTTPSSPSSA